MSRNNQRILMNDSIVSFKIYLFITIPEVYYYSRDVALQRLYRAPYKLTHKHIILIL